MELTVNDRLDEIREVAKSLLSSIEYEKDETTEDYSSLSMHIAVIRTHIEGQDEMIKKQGRALKLMADAVAPYVEIDEEDTVKHFMKKAGATDDDI